MKTENKLFVCFVVPARHQLMLVFKDVIFSNSVTSKGIGIHYRRAVNVGVKVTSYDTTV